MKNRKFLPIIQNSIINNWELPALSNYGGETYTYEDFACKIAELHVMFDLLDLKKGDKVALCSQNMSNWAVAFFASLSYGLVATSILHEFNPENIHGIVTHSDSKLFFVGGQIWSKLDESEMAGLEAIVQLEDFAVIKSPLHDLSSRMTETYKKKYPNGFTRDDVKFHDEAPEELAVLNYTSGTTSTPKGVMIPYRSLWSNTRFAVDSISFVESGSGIVCMLPMAHMYGLAFEVLLSVSKGCHIHFLNKAPSPQVVIEAFSKVKPSLILVVPLIIEKIIKNKVFVELEKQPAKTLLKIPFLNQLVYKKVLAQLLTTFGGKLKEIVVGGAGLNSEVGDFLMKIKFPFTVGYGMTECGPLISYEFWKEYSPTSCGRIVDNMEVKIDSADPENISGEILVRGMNVMLGYYKNEEETKAAFTPDGWLKTGDLGVLDSKGHLYIKGRSKTMILGASGQNIYPEEIEGLLNNYPYVSESLVVAKAGKLIALIEPDADQMKSHHITNADWMQSLSIISML